MRRVVETNSAPAAIGPYSQAVKYEGKVVFTAGQIGMDSHTGELVEGGIIEQTEQALNNMREVLEASQSALSLVLKVTMYLVDMDDFQTVNRVYANYFVHEPPARSAVQVTALPKGALIELDCVAASK
ncbi:MAG: reactive intermediate/imine deaminase [Calditrichaeota bacterium]|jgi:2-iminobutanoate/2-iminopropanoate deaminase|nr:reactive intermediate/imine deaminase [Calditrichota bacterium]MBT7619146.1 reactive intermediate/imine deaminase [Calditrichota bacterium]MBT7789109.1 reactive intermediate/imine deaminase [Calditrichota bacterium]